MKYFAVVGAIVLVYLSWRPEILYPFDTPVGRTLLLAAVIYLVQMNQLLGLLAALAVSRVFDRSPPTLMIKQSPDRMQVDYLMRAQASEALPVLRTSAAVLGNDPFFNYAWY
jgi:hypothetical protein